MNNPTYYIFWPLVSSSRGCWQQTTRSTRTNWGISSQATCPKSKALPQTSPENMLVQLGTFTVVTNPSHWDVEEISVHRDQHSLTWTPFSHWIVINHCMADTNVCKSPSTCIINIHKYNQDNPNGCKKVPLGKQQVTVSIERIHLNS